MDQVIEFLSHHNRPFTANDIVQNLGKELGKSQVLSALNKLVSKNAIIEKNCGKQKIYCITQKSTLPMKEMNAKVLEIERQSTSLAKKLKEVEDDLSRKECALMKMERTLTREEVLEKKKTLEEEIKELQLQLESFQGETYEKQDREKIEQDYTKVLKEYNKRKRLCMDMVGAIFENYPKSKKQLLQEIGIETDDDVGFTLKVEIK